MKIKQIQIKNNLLGNRTKLNKKNKNKELINNTNNSNKLPPIITWKYNLFGFLLIFIITIISSPLLKYISPSAYEFINNLYSHGGQWITYPGILWLTGWFVHALLEALLLVLLSFGLYSVPTNLPQFIINWIHKLDTESKSEIKAIYLQI